MNAFSGNCAASVSISTFMYLWAIYIFPRSVYIFSCRRIGISVVGTYKSLTDTWMWILGLWPRNSFSVNILFEFLALVLCNVISDILAGDGKIDNLFYSVHWGRIYVDEHPGPRSPHKNPRWVHVSVVHFRPAAWARTSTKIGNSSATNADKLVSKYRHKKKICRENMINGVILFNGVIFMYLDSPR